MMTSKLAVFHGAGLPLTIETVPVPELREGEILIRNEYVTLCRSDLNTFAGKRMEKTPTILGHEIVGVVEAFAGGAPARDCRRVELRVGDRVTWAIYASNPDSDLARMGIPQKVPGLVKYGHECLLPDNTLHGGLAEFCVLRKNTPVIRIDGSLPLPLMALINCSVATVAGALRLAGSVRDRKVIIAGAGMLGIIASAMCACAGAKQIIALDIDHDRLATAKKFGVDFTINLKAGGQPIQQILAESIPGAAPTVALDFSGVPETMETLVSLLGIGGTLVCIGATFPQRALQINAEQLIRNLHTIKGLHNYNEQDFVTAVEFMEQNHQRFPFASLVHDRFNLEAVNEAFAYGIATSVHRVGIRIGREH